MTTTVAFDGPDYSGKSTLVRMIKQALEALGFNVGMVNHPSNVSETGQFARLKLVTGAANDVVAKAMCQDFEYTLQYIVPQYDIVLLDRWVPVTIANQRDEGRVEVFRSGVCNMPNSPQIYVSSEVGYKTACERKQKRLDEAGVDWDDAVSGTMFTSPEAWAEACERYRYAFHIVTEGGDKFQWLRLNEDTSQHRKVLDVVNAIVAHVEKQ